MNNVLMVGRSVFFDGQELRRREENACLPPPSLLRRDICQRGRESTYSVGARKSSWLVGLDPGRHLLSNWVIPTKAIR